MGGENFRRWPCIGDYGLRTPACPLMGLFSDICVSGMPKKLILCVDDEKVVLNTLMAQLTQTFGNRYSYESFTSAEEAEEFIDEVYAEGSDVNVIVCDWLMPRIKGDEFLVRVHKRFPKVALIMLSGQASPEAIERAQKEANILAFVQKPWDKDYLMGLIQKALEGT
jgi:DNA-binding NtrC family response regulator